MPHITIKQPPKYHQISFEDMMAGIEDLSKYIMPNITNTRTYWTDRPNTKLLENANISRMVEILKTFNQSKEALFAQDRASLYRTFYIPKSSGGLRRIDAPLPELMNALRELKTLLETHMFALYHTSAFAYIRGRSTIDALKRHQQNESKWFLKLDFADFFGSTTPEFVLDMLSRVFPFSEVVKYSAGGEDSPGSDLTESDSVRSNSIGNNSTASNPVGGDSAGCHLSGSSAGNCLSGKQELQKALNLCFLNNGLPQGTPISPFLTNVMMIAIDHKISNGLRNFDNRRFVYTRYADDILISCKIDFDKELVQKFIVETLTEFGAPFSIKKEKTRYGSSAGRNWNLGLMLNGDNQITIGHKRKKEFKAMLDNYMRSRKAGNGSNSVDSNSIGIVVNVNNDDSCSCSCGGSDNIITGGFTTEHSPWSHHDIQVLGGLISYYRMVEKDYINYLLHQYSNKHGADIEKCIKADLLAQVGA